MSASASKHRAGVRATIPAVQVQEEEESLFKADAVNKEEEEEEEEEEESRTGQGFQNTGTVPLSSTA